eukprot:10392260-Ditylum_brightwellii.AAC.1
MVGKGLPLIPKRTAGVDLLQEYCNMHRHLIYPQWETPQQINGQCVVQIQKKKGRLPCMICKERVIRHSLRHVYHVVKGGSLWKHHQLGGA